MHRRKWKNNRFYTTNTSVKRHIVKYRKSGKNNKWLKLRLNIF